LRVAKRFQDARAKVKIIGFPKRNNSSSSRHNLSWVHDGIEVVELVRGAREEIFFKPVPSLRKRRVTFPLAIACYRLAYARQIARLCEGSSVLHSFGTGMEMNGYAVAAAAKILGARFVIEPAIHAGSCGDSWLDAPLYHKADLLLAHTDFEAGVIQTLGVPKKTIRTIVHGVDFCDSGDGRRFRARHGIGGPMVLFLGRKTREKGVARLLEAWPLVVAKFPEATLVIAGPKSIDFEILKSEKLKAESRNLPATGYPLPATAPESLLQVLNLDDLSEGEKQDVLSTCNILCVPSEGESFGMVYFEAWAYKKPVVALDLPVLRETIGRHGGGLLCTSEPSDIAASLIQLLGNLELQKNMGAKGHAIALQHHWPAALESYSKAYQDNLSL
jgi:glycosyltransferase involved in cell wall biosynthesis